ncbi:hypothetical protein CapIbe_023141 [Capra ibex]
MALVSGSRSLEWNASQFLEEPRPRRADALACSRPGDRNGLGRQSSKRGSQDRGCRSNEPGRSLGQGPGGEEKKKRTLVIQKKDSSA